MKPSIPQGTRDFPAAVLRKRNHILDTIRSVFLLYGFEPLETPAMENIETLMGKYGDEGDKLLFKILNNGLHLPEKKETALKDFQQVLEGKNTKGITERALRYDLTIPFARFVAMNHQQLTLPYKRFQMQPVWRADRPQRGRYREFWQCDADVAGSLSLLHESELVNVYKDVFRLLRIPVAIHINNRKILSALATLCGGEDLMAHITVAIDKLDKIGPEKVKDELIGKGLSMEQVERVEHYMSIQGDTLQRLQQLDELFAEVPIGKEGIGELRQILELSQSNDQAECIVDPTLARGLNYYTGSIFEIKAKGIEMGSIGGGGRYDDLTGLFGVKGIPGVGISFGVDRIYDVMEELTLFPDHIHSGTKALIFRTSEHELRYQMDLAAVLRKNGIACELFHELVKFDKQFKYAERKGIPYVIIAGSEEMKKTTYLVKNLASGEQREYALEQLISMLIA